MVSLLALNTPPDLFDFKRESGVPKCKIRSKSSFFIIDYSLNSFINKSDAIKHIITYVLSRNSNSSTTKIKLHVSYYAYLVYDTTLGTHIGLNTDKHTRLAIFLWYNRPTKISKSTFSYGRHIPIVNTQDQIGTSTDSALNYGHPFRYIPLWYRKHNTIIRDVYTSCNIRLFKSYPNRIKLMFYSASLSTFYCYRYLYTKYYQNDKNTPQDIAQDIIRNDDKNIITRKINTFLQGFIEYLKIIFIILVMLHAINSIIFFLFF